MTQFKNIFITGGAGYVGSALVPTLLKKNYNVSVYDLYLYGDIFSDLKSNPNLNQIKGDIRDKKKLIETVKDADAIIHLACISNDPSFELNPTLGKSINFDAFFNVLDAAKENNVSRLIYASTSSVYGLKSEKNVVEDATLEPLTDYSKYKAECERVLQTGTFPFDWVIVRPATVCGYAKRLRLDLVVNIITINALVNHKIKVFAGTQLRPNINIRDMITVYELMLTAKKEEISSCVFNAGFQNLSLLEIASLVKEVYGKTDLQIQVEPTKDIRSYHINSDKIQNILGFRPRY